MSSPQDFSWFSAPARKIYPCLIPFLELDNGQPSQRRMAATNSSLCGWVLRHASGSAVRCRSQRGRSIDPAWHSCHCRSPGTLLLRSEVVSASRERAWTNVAHRKYLLHSRGKFIAADRETSMSNRAKFRRSFIQRVLIQPISVRNIFHQLLGRQTSGLHAVAVRTEIPP